ncbi:hypothetical protein CORT_0E05910 [Candida orthopsilosis Co 90-125]|uniref:BHLH domain-containing protein n=1 Tax=Candida orthopsilosis (strain 90-125) TaxID=1136231 RepID=H8X875_CANO9|nr:hypothetical protein CORT_0E05910 [Candida orthopsilosis Co 90-125]CCG24174.1 hypothetical protein CORT_0E05910 [Candida orthopsilosis Co 90-125]
MTYKDSKYNAYLTTTMYDKDYKQILDQQHHHNNHHQQQQQQQHQLEQQKQESLQLGPQQQFQSQNGQNSGPQGNLYQNSSQNGSTPTPNAQHYRHLSVARCTQTQDDNQSVTSNSTEPQQSPSSMQLQIKEEQQQPFQGQQYPVKIEDNPCFACSTDNLMKIDDTNMENNNGISFQEEFDFTLNPAFPQYMINGRAKALSLPSSTSISNEYQQNNFSCRELPSNTEYLGDEVVPFTTAADAATAINYTQLENELPIHGNDIDGNQFQQQSFMGNGTMMFKSNDMVPNGYDPTMNNGIMGPQQQQQSSQHVSSSTPLGSPLTVQNTPPTSGVSKPIRGNLMPGIDAKMTSVNTSSQHGDLSSNGSLDEESNNSFRAQSPTVNATGFSMSSSATSSASALSIPPNGIATMTKTRLQNFGPVSKSPSLSPLTDELRQLPTTPSASPPPSSRVPSVNKQKRREFPANNGNNIKQDVNSTTTDSVTSFNSSQAAPPLNPGVSSLSSSFATTTLPVSSASLLRRSHTGRPRVKSAHNVIEQRYRNKINNKFNALQESVPTLKVLLLRKLQEKQRLRIQRQNGDLDDSNYAGGGTGGDESLSDNEDLNNFEGIDLSILDDKEIESIDLEGLEPARKLNKGTILAKSIEYIKFLESKNDKLKQDHESLLNKAKTMGINIEKEGDSNMG